MPLFFWTQRQDIGPRARAGHAAAYDAGRHRTVLFGGIVGDAVAGDTPGSGPESFGPRSGTPDRLPERAPPSPTRPAVSTRCCSGAE
jgi:hypothetical protein